jgi:diguanylate cyclase (GGDEF)-like protein
MAVPPICLDRGLLRSGPYNVSTRLRVLLIEDSEDDAMLVVRALKGGGFDVASERIDTASGLKAALNRQPWDLAIADFSMPGFSGSAALAIVREHDADLPFIFVSGTIGEDVAVAAMRTGAHDYIIKGNLTRLVPAVERELRDAAVRRDRTRAEQRIEHLAYHDPLTDLPNRTLMQDRLQQAILVAERADRPVSLLVMDLDGFKEINDALGHQAGDRVLQEVAARLQAIVRDPDTVARLGGDEFAIVLPSTDVEAAEQTARRALVDLGRPFVVEGRPIVVHASIGLARFPEHGATAEVLLQKADVAMYVAKSDKSGLAIYALDRDRHTDRRLSIIADLRAGLDTGQFFVEYQPVLHLATNVVQGVEALVRWQHPQQGRLEPGDFIDLAEQTGLVNPLTMFVLGQALDDWAPKAFRAPLTIAVNLSPRNLHEPQLPERILAAVHAHGVPPSQVVLEITETVIMSDPTRSTAVLTQLHDMGIRLVVDDFGTGYSSLTYLRRLPVSGLKIDRSFVLGLDRGEDEVIVRSTIDLAHNLGLTVIAEGVESSSVFDQLLALGCDAVQGSFVSEPRSADETRTWISSMSQKR